MIIFDKSNVGFRTMTISTGSRRELRNRNAIYTSYFPYAKRVKVSGMRVFRECKYLPLITLNGQTY